MDTISVTQRALFESYNALERFGNKADELTKKCQSEIEVYDASYDDILKKKMRALVEDIVSLNERVQYCINENKACVKDRMNRIPAYENAIYRKQRMN